MQAVRNCVLLSLCNRSIRVALVLLVPLLGNWFSHTQIEFADACVAHACFQLLLLVSCPNFLHSFMRARVCVPFTGARRDALGLGVF
jgi:hypothetical protein